VPLAKDNDASVELFRVFPNPAHSDVTVFVSSPGVIELYTIDGRSVYRADLKVGYTVMKLPSDLAAGMYLSKFTSASNEVLYLRLEYIPR
jgi:hypothetical protein